MKLDSFRDLILDQLRDLGRVTCRGMFGGHGLYTGNVFFGIIFKGRLYFKTDSTSRSAYIEMDMKPFRPNAKMTLKTYYEVPVEIIEDQDQLTTWAKKAIQYQMQLKSPSRRKR